MPCRKADKIMGINGETSWIIYDGEKPVYFYKQNKFTGSLLEKSSLLGDLVVSAIDNGFLGFPKIQENILLESDNFSKQEGRITEFVQSDEKRLYDYEKRFKIASMPNQEIQKIWLLDYLIYNYDRHVGNVLIKDNCLIPIDHDCSLIEIDLNLKDFFCNSLNYFGGVFKSRNFMLLGLMSSDDISDKLSPPFTGKLKKWINSLNVKNQLAYQVDKNLLRKETLLGLRIREVFLKYLVNNDINLYKCCTSFSLRSQRQLFQETAKLTRLEINQIFSSKILPPLNKRLSGKKKRHYKRLYQKYQNEIEDAFVRNLEIAISEYNYLE